MTGPEVRPRSACRHNLPVSNGWNQAGSGPPSVYCGRCGVEVDCSADNEWDARYRARRGYSPLAEIAADRARHELLKRDAAS